jgi:hypothetical protein
MKTQLTPSRGSVALGIVLAVALADFLLPVARAQVRLGVGSSRGFPATAITIPVGLTARSNIVALQADIVHDGAALSMASASAGTATGGNILLSSAPAPGVRRLLLYSPAGGPLNDGEVAQLPVVVGPNIYQGFYRLTLTNVMVATSSAQPLICTNRSGVIVVSPVFIRQDGGVDFFLNVTPDQTYLVQASTNLIDWLTLSTNLAIGPYLEMTEEGAGMLYPQRFYRALPTAP